MKLSFAHQERGLIGIKNKRNQGVIHKKSSCFILTITLAMFVFLTEMPLELPHNVWTWENPSLPHMRLALIVTWESHETRPIAVIVIRESVNSPTRVIHIYIYM